MKERPFEANRPETRDAGDGDLDRLLPLVYDELRRLAGAFLHGERADHTLQPTALVHEAYLRLLGDGRAPWNDRAHFFRAAAQAMRRILVDHARARGRRKRGGDLERRSLDSAVADPDRLTTDPERLLDLEEALSELEGLDGLAVRVVEMRYFAGLTVEETAQALAVSARTVNRSWTVARAWLHGRLGRSTAGERRETEPADA